MIQTMKTLMTIRESTKQMASSRARRESKFDTVQTQMAESFKEADISIICPLCKVAFTTHCEVISCDKAHVFHSNCFRDEIQKGLNDDEIPAQEDVKCPQCLVQIKILERHKAIEKQITEILEIPIESEDDMPDTYRPALATPRMYFKENPMIQVDPLTDSKLIKE